MMSGTNGYPIRIQDSAYIVGMDALYCKGEDAAVFFRLFRADYMNMRNSLQAFKRHRRQ